MKSLYAKNNVLLITYQQLELLQQGISLGINTNILLSTLLLRKGLQHLYLFCEIVAGKFAAKISKSCLRQATRRSDS